MAIVCDAGTKLLLKFLFELLDNSKHHTSIIAWTDRDSGQFRLIKRDAVSSLKLYCKFSIAELACLFMTIYGEIFKIKNKNKTLIDYYI